MKYQVRITRTADGAQVEYDHNMDYPGVTKGTTLFWWEEGSASCDCNRRQFFYENGGSTDDQYDNDSESNDCSCLYGGVAYKVALKFEDEIDWRLCEQ